MNFVSDFKYWEDKKLYIQLMEQFMTKKINLTSFDAEICHLWRTDRDKNYSSKEVLQKLEISNIPPIQLKNFSSLISEVFIACDLCQANSTLLNDNDCEISEEELRRSVKKILLEIKYNYP